MQPTFQLEIPNRDIGKNKNINPDVVTKSLTSAEMSWTEFEQHLKAGLPYSFNRIERKHGHRNAPGFISAAHFAMDSDKNATLAEILNPANPLAKYIRYIAPSPSDKPDYRKLRVIFTLAQPNADLAVHKAMLQTIYDEFLRFGVRFDPASLSPTIWYYAKEVDEIEDFTLKSSAIPSADYHGILRIPGSPGLEYSTFQELNHEIEHREAASTIEIETSDLKTFGELLEKELRAAGILLSTATSDKAFQTFKLTHCHTSSEHAQKDLNRGAYSHAKLTIWNDGGLSYKCHGGTCEKKSIYHFLRNYRISDPELKARIDAATKRSNYTVQRINSEKYPHTRIVEERYLSNAVSIADILQRLVILDSAMGTGKTEVEKNFVQHCEQQGLSVLTLIPRKTLGTQAAVRFGVRDYQGESRAERTTVQSRTICVPSLDSLVDEENGVIPEYDILLIDEPSNVLRFFTAQGAALFNSEGPSTHALRCMNVLKEIGRKAKKIVIAEACLNPVVAWLLRRIFDLSLDDCFVVKNEYHENLPVTVWSITDEIKNSELYTAVKQFFGDMNKPGEAPNRFRDWMVQTMLQEAVSATEQANIPLIVACDEKEDGAHSIRRLLIEKHDISEDDILTVTAETKDIHAVDRFLLDPNDYISSHKPKVIIHTAAMETGFSVEHPCGVVVIADGRNHTLEASAIMQMIGRCRKPAFIHCLLDERFRFEKADPRELITASITNHKYLEAKHSLQNHRLSESHAWIYEIHGRLTAESNRQRMRLIESVPAFLEANGYDLKWRDIEELKQRGCDFDSLIGEQSLINRKAVLDERIARQDAIVESTPVSPDVAKEHRRKDTLTESLIAGEKKSEILSLSGAEWTIGDNEKVKDKLLLNPNNAGQLKFLEKSTFDSEGKPYLVPTKWTIENKLTGDTDWVRLKKTKGFIVPSEFLDARADITDDALFSELFVNNAVKRFKLHTPRNRKRFDAFCDFHEDGETLVNWDFAEVSGATPMREFKDPKRQIVGFVKRVIENLDEKSAQGTVWVRDWDRKRIDALGFQLKFLSVCNLDAYIQALFERDSGVQGFTVTELIKTHFPSTARFIDQQNYLTVCRAVLYDYYYRIKSGFNPPISDEKLVSVVQSLGVDYEQRRTDGQTVVILDAQAVVKTSETIEKSVSRLNHLEPEGKPLGVAWFATSDEQKILGVPCRVYRSVAIDTEQEDILLSLMQTPQAQTTATSEETEKLKSRIHLVTDAQAAQDQRTKALDQVTTVLRETDRPLTIKEIIDLIGLDDDNSTKRAVYRELDKLMKAGEVVKTGYRKNAAYLSTPAIGQASKLKERFPDLEAIKSVITNQPKSISQIADALKLDINHNTTRQQLKRSLKQLIDDEAIHAVGTGKSTGYVFGTISRKEHFLDEKNLYKNGLFRENVPKKKSPAIPQMPVCGEAVSEERTEEMPVCGEAVSEEETEAGVFKKKTTHFGRKTEDIRYLVNSEDVAPSLEWLGDAKVLGFDFETWCEKEIEVTNPRYVLEAHPRLLSISDGKRTVLLDCVCLAAFKRQLAAFFDGKTLIAHNGMFDLAFLSRWGIHPHRVVDTLLLETVALDAEGDRTTRTLEALCEKYLSRTLDKAPQHADWSPGNALSDELIQYSATDAQVLVPLKAALDEKIRQLGMSEEAYLIFCDVLPAFVEAKLQGMPVDVGQMQAIKSRLETEAQRFEQELVFAYGQYGYTTANSSAKIRRVLGLAFEVEAKSADEDTLKALALETDNPALVSFCDNVLKVRKSKKTAKELQKYEQSAVQGRIHANFQVGNAKGGRTTCDSPNLQQVSKHTAIEGVLERGAVRRCFVAPEGYQLVVADYSQIELVLNAVGCGEESMLSAFRRGDDIHALTASKIYNKPIEDVTKEERQIGKTANFGLQYGMGAEGFQSEAKSVGIELTLFEARQIRGGWLKAYPKIAARHSHVKSRKPNQISTVCGRVIDTQKASYMNVLNYPVQGSGADLLYRAIAVIHENLKCFDACMVHFVHDEIVTLVIESEAEAVAKVVEEGMLEAGRELYPEYQKLIRCEVEIRQQWGE